jgi:preprotein translocase subunit SecF
MRILANANFNFIRWRWHAIVLSVVVVVAGVANIARNGVPLGIDFSGGSALLLESPQPLAVETVRAALANVSKESIVQPLNQPGPGRYQILVRLPLMSGTEQGANLEEDSRRAEDALRAANVGAFKIEGTELVGPVIGRDLQRKGIYATVAALLGIMTYIALRFRLSFGVGAMVASLHDVLVTLSILTFAGYELTLNVVAAILTLTGYGVNDQIVVFDRVRENLRTSRREPIDTVINRSVNQTLPRTVITAGVTFLSVVGLYLFGGEVLRGFAFTLLVGIVTSTYSTVYVASAVAVVLSGRRASSTQAAATRRAPDGRRAS